MLYSCTHMATVGVKRLKFFQLSASLEESLNVIYRVRIKKEPLGKIRYLWNGSKFFRKLTVLTEKDSDHIICKIHRNIWLHSKIITI